MTPGPFTRRDHERKMQAAGRLPPGQSLTLKFPVLDLGSQPAVDPDRWELRIHGAVVEELRLTMADLGQLPRDQVVMDIHCVTKWSKFETQFEGFSPARLVQEGVVRPGPGAAYVLQHGADGYTTNLPLSVVLQENYLLATHAEGKPLTREHGFPLRAVIGHLPGRKPGELFTPYLWKGAKWLVGLEFLTEDEKGFWEKNGYSNTADVWGEERFGR